MGWKSRIFVGVLGWIVVMIWYQYRYLYANGGLCTSSKIYVASVMALNKTPHCCLQAV